MSQLTKIIGDRVELFEIPDNSNEWPNKRDEISQEKVKTYNSPSLMI